MDWRTPEVKEAAIKAVRRSKTLEEAAHLLSKELARNITKDSLQSAFQRWRKATPDMPSASFLVGADVGLETLPEPLGPTIQATPVQAPTLVYPPGVRPMEPPPDSYVEHSGEVASILVLSDVHIPIHDKPAVDAVIAFIRDIKPTVIVANGDILDFWLLSSYEKEAERFFDPGARLQEEFDTAQPFWKELYSNSGKVHFIPGNHENRLQRFINMNPGLFGLRALEWRSLAEIPEQITVHKYGTRLSVGPVQIVHGDSLGNNRKGPPKHGAAWVLENQPARSVIYGHTHKQQLMFRPQYDELGRPHQYVAINGGHLSDVGKQRYVIEPPWTTGFVYMECWSDNNGKTRFTPNLIPVINGQFSYGGRRYGLRTQ